MSQPLLRCEQLEVGYAGRAVLPPVDLEIRPGEFWALLGRNGSGKTTWFKTVLGLLPAVSGRVDLAPTTQLAYVAQRMTFDDLYPVSALDVVAMGRLRTGRMWRPWMTAEERDRVRDALESLNATSLAKRTFRSLSEGQKQRVLLARMVVSEAQIAFLDEPTAAMDAVAERRTMDLLDRLRVRYGMSVVVVTHHLEVIRRCADRVLFVDPDLPAVVAGTPGEVFASEPFLARYHDAYEAHV